MRGRYVPGTAQLGSSGTVSWDGLTDKPTLYSPFCIWAEENADLGSGSFEWAFGNGNDTPSGMGVIVPFDCELFAIGLTLEGSATCTVEVRRNTSSSGKSVSTQNSKKELIAFEDDPVVYAAGDVVNFRTITGHSNSNGGIVVAWLRRIVI